MSGIAGGSEQFSAGESGLVKQPLDCAVRAFMITYMYIVYCRHHGLGHLLNLRCCKPTKLYSCPMKTQHPSDAFS